MSFLVAFVISAGMTGVLIVLLRRAKVLDVPNSRSSHQVPTPRGGGVAVMLATVVALVVVGDDVNWALLVAALGLAVVGLADDLWSLPAIVRLLAQVGVAAAGAASLMSGSVQWAPILLVLGVLGVVAYVNAFNFMDGVNGISALQAAVAGSWFVWTGTAYEVAGLSVVGAALVGASLGFLPWNATGRIFLGDVGSYGLGALIALMTLAAWANGVPALVAVAPLTVYLADTGWVLIKRARAHESLTTPHRDHVYQRLVRRGWTHLSSATWSTAIAGLCCMSVGLLADCNMTVLIPLPLVLLAVLYLVTPRIVNASIKSHEGAA